MSPAQEEDLRERAAMGLLDDHQLTTEIAVALRLARVYLDSRQLDTAARFANLAADLMKALRHEVPV